MRYLCIVNWVLAAWGPGPGLPFLRSLMTMPQNKFQMDQLSERTNEAIEVLEENMKEFLMTLEWQRLV